MYPFPQPEQVKLKLFLCSLFVADFRSECLLDLAMEGDGEGGGSGLDAANGFTFVNILGIRLSELTPLGGVGALL
jgi:hypothetical protein